MPCGLIRWDWSDLQRQTNSCHNFNRSGAGAFREEHADSLSWQACDYLWRCTDEAGIAHVQDVMSKLGSRVIDTRVVTLPNGYIKTLEIS